MLQTLGFPAGGRQIDAKATFFRYESGSAGGADESINVNADGQDLGVFWPGDAVHLPVEATRWRIVPVTATTIGTVRLGLGWVESARLVGTVQVIDTAKQTTISKQSFVANAGVGAVAAQYARAGIWNPAGSGKRAVIEKIYFSSGTSQTWYMGYSAVSLATIDDTPRNKLLNGPGPSAIKRAFDTNATFGLNHTAAYVFSGTKEVIELKTPIVLTPGLGFTLYNSVVNTDLNMNIEFIEESNV